MESEREKYKSRRSLGTRQSHVQPQRLAAAAAAASNPRPPLAESSNKKNGGGGGGGMSRLPRPSNSRIPSATKSKAGGGGKRSSSLVSSSGTRGRSAVAHQLTTPQQPQRPRSQSGGMRTPLRMGPGGGAGAPFAVGLASASGASAAASAARYSMGGSSARGSTIGVKAVRDSRPLADKAWQKKAITEIMHFLAANHFPKQLGPGDFPLTSTNFKGIFEFLMRFFRPTYTIPAKQLELELPKQLREMGYQAQLSKASFQTLGTQHSWPSILGVLHYLAQRAVVLIDTMENMPQHCFPNTDEHGFQNDSGENEEKVVYEIYKNWYKDFLMGRDDEALLQEKYLGHLRGILQVNRGVNQEREEQLLRENKALKEELRSLETAPNCLQNVKDSYNETENAIRGYLTYLEETKTYVSKKKAELNAVRQAIADMEEKKSKLQEDVSALENDCRVKGLDLDLGSITATKREAARKEKQSQIDLKSEAKRKTAEHIADLEMQLSKAKQELNKHMGDVQARLRFVLDADHPAVVAAQSAAPQDAYAPVQNLIGELTEQILKLKISRDEVTTAVEKTEQKVASLEQDRKETESETETLKRTLVTLEREIEQKEADLRKEVDALKSSVLQMKDERHVSQDALDQLQSEVAAMEAEFRAKEEKRESQLREWIAKVDQGRADFVDWMRRRKTEKEEKVAHLERDVAKAVRELVRLKKGVSTELKATADECLEILRKKD